MGFNTLSVTNLEFKYDNNPLSVFNDLNFSVSSGWTGIVGANGEGKSTLLRLISRELEPGRGSITGPDIRILCEQKTDRYPPEAGLFFSALYEKDGLAGKLFGRLGLDHDWPYRWDTLSFGERKRLQLACVFFSEPDILLLDEPTNHLDSDAVGVILSVLEDFNGIGLIVSHDREVLNRLCRANIFLSGGGGLLRPGSLDDGLTREQSEAESSRREYQAGRKRLEKMKKELHRRKEAADRHKKDFSKSGLSRKDRDGRARIDGLRLTGKDSTGIRLAKRMEDRVRREADSLSKQTVPGMRKRGITFNREFSGGTGGSVKRDRLFRLSKGDINLGKDKILRYPELSMRPSDRISLTGSNGAGKTTLINLILASPELKMDEVLYLPQELSPEMSKRLYEEFLGLDQMEKGNVLSHFYRLNGEPESILETSLPSPGELRKLSVSMGLNREVGLIILDEPTNHLDLPSRQAMEEALELYEAALLLVSHDAVFRSRLTAIEWHLGTDGNTEIRV